MLSLDYLFPYPEQSYKKESIINCDLQKKKQREEKWLVKKHTANQGAEQGCLPRFLKS